jgi:hypothetical protein
MPASEKQVKANRKIAKKSIGPKTRDAKARARRKGENHGKNYERTQFHVNIPTAKTNAFDHTREAKIPLPRANEPNSMQGKQ